ncbi:hypothetical protein VE00_04518 [Pseudogymnoascus sp. WSF 3629]|nr:hypothetical protein VE00_04518 [Pseudogymnoascus sp. WSF 3629]
MTEPNQVSKIWEAAIRRYEEVTNKKLDGPSVRSLTTVNELRDAIEDQNKVFADFRQKRHGLYAALSAAMGPIELVGAAAGEAAAMVFPPSIFVFAAVQYLIGAAKGVSEKYDAIVEVLEALKDFTVRLETYAHHLMSRGLGGKMAEILAVILEILAISQKEMKRGRLVSFGKSLIGATDEGKAAMEKLGKLFDSEKGIVGAETLSEVKSIAIAVDKLNIEVSTLVNSQSAHAAQDQNPLRKIRAILDPSGRPDEMYHTFKRNRVSETGAWIRNEHNFKAWMGGEKPILWISGNPGAGKSYIATNVITDLVAAYPKRHEDTSTVSIGYFFFKDDNPRTRSFHQGLRDIAYMISQSDQAYAKHILATCDTPEDVSSLYKVWQKLFISFFKDNDTTHPPKRKIFIVLDGLDEAIQEERTEFLELAKDISHSNQMQLVMFGRLQVMDDIEQYLEMPDVPTIHVTAETNSQDIRRYIRSTISKAVYLKKSSKLLLNEIITQISKKAQGMFTWVNLIFTDILRMRGEGVIRKALQEAPRGLPKMIRHVLEGYSISLRESPDVLHDFNEILIWVAVTARPLKLEEINSVLKWRSDSGEGMIGLERSLRTQFASFFTLIRQDGLSTADLQKLRHGAETLSIDEDRKLCSQSASEDEDWDGAEDESDSDPLTTEVTFSHASFGDFFHDENEGPVSGGQNTLPAGVDIRNARVRVFCACLDIMSCEPGSPKEPVALELRSYVASVWLELLRKIDITKTSEEDKKAIADGLMSVLTKSPGLADVNWNTQLTNRKSLDLLKVWLGSSPAPEIKEWYSLATAENDADLIADVIRRIGKRWLATSSGDWLLDARAVAGFMAFRSGEEPKPGLVSDETILKCANWLSLEQDALWNLRLGATLRDFRHYTQALGHFEKSASLTPKEEQWPIRHSKSWLYMEMCKYDTAAELDVEMYQELEALHKEQDSKESKKWDIDLHKVCHRLAICYRELKKEDQEIDYLEKATSYDMRCYLCLRKLITLHWFRQNFDSITAKLVRMDVQLPDKEYTGLIEALLTGLWTQDEEDFKYIAVAALYSQKLDWLLMAYNTAIQTAKKERRTVVAVSLELSIAVIYDKGINRHDEGAEIYKRILDIYGDTRIDLMLVRSLVNAKCYLGSYLIWKAIEDDGPLSEAGQECGRQLEDLVHKKLRLVVDDNVPSYADRELDMDLYEKNLIKSSVAFMGHSVCYLYLGNYYKLVGRMEDAMAQYAEVVRGCLEILDNDDAADDFAAFSVLFPVIASAIGPEEAVDIFYLSWANRAILAQLWAKRTDIITTEHEGSKSTIQIRLAPSNNMSRAESEKDEKKIEETSISPQTLSWTVEEVECLGCWNDFKPGQWEKYYMCYHCMYGFCIDCYTKLRNKTYEGPACSPRHDWYEIPAPSEELMKNWQVGKLFCKLLLVLDAPV